MSTALGVKKYSNGCIVEGRNKGGHVRARGKEHGITLLFSCGGPDWEVESQHNERAGFYIQGVTFIQEGGR